MQSIHIQKESWINIKHTDLNNQKWNILAQKKKDMKLKWFGVQTNRSRNVKFISPNLKGRQCHVDFVLRKQGMTHLEYLRGSCFLFSRWYFNNSNSFIGYKLVVTRLIWKHPHLTRALVLLITIESRLYFFFAKNSPLTGQEQAWTRIT